MDPLEPNNPRLVASITTSRGDEETDVRYGEASSPEVFNDPRLIAQLRVLVGRRLSQFSMAMGGIRLTFWGEEVGTISREVMIEQSSFELAQPGRPLDTCVWNDDLVATSLLRSLNKAVTRIDVTHGHLTVAFEHGLRLQVEPDQHYESWQISSEDDLLIVCAPGGELTVWYPTTTGD